MPGKEMVALVTGGSRGIGRAICIELARQGLKVGVNHSSTGSADEVLEYIKNIGGYAIGIQGDISNEKKVRHVIDKTVDTFGRIDILVNNAGISDQLIPILEQESDTWQKVVDIHLKGTYLCSKEVAGIMLKNNFGRIVNISSIVGLNGFPMRTAYGPAKAGIINLTKVLAIEWAKYNINVNAVAPGYIKTEMVEQLIKKGTFIEDHIRERIPMKRLGTTKDIAQAVLFLISDEASYITGTTLVVDGGWTAYGSV